MFKYQVFAAFQIEFTRQSSEYQLIRIPLRRGLLILFDTSPALVWKQETAETSAFSNVARCYSIAFNFHCP